MNTRKGRMKGGRESRAHPPLCEVMLVRVRNLAAQIRQLHGTDRDDLECVYTAVFEALCSVLEVGCMKPHMSLEVGRVLLEAVASLPADHEAVTVARRFCALRAPSLLKAMPPVEAAPADAAVLAEAATPPGQ